MRKNLSICKTCAFFIYPEGCQKIIFEKTDDVISALHKKLDYQILHKDNGELPIINSLEMPEKCSYFFEQTVLSKRA